MELQTPSAPGFLSLAPSLEILCSAQWMAMSIHFCISQALAEPLRRQLYQAPVSKNLLASTIVSRFLVTVYRMDPQVGQSLDGLSFSFWFKLCLCISSMGILIPLLRRTEVSTLWYTFFLSFIWSVNYILGIPNFWANIHLSVTAFHVCSFVTELPHLGDTF